VRCAIYRSTDALGEAPAVLATRKYTTLSRRRAGPKGNGRRVGD
jgi:hypothetical protein